MRIRFLSRSHSIFIVLSFLAMLVPWSIQAEDVLNTESSRVVSYRGPDAMYVTIQEFDHTEHKRALVTVEQHPVLGKEASFLTELIEDRHGIRYVTLYEASPRSIVEKRVHSSGSVEIFVPRFSERGSYRFEFPKRESEAQLLKRDSKRFLESYLYAQKSSAELRLPIQLKQLKERCKQELPIDFQESDFAGAFKSEHSAEAMCADGLRGILAICTDTAGIEAVEKGIKKLVCMPGNSFKASLDDETLTIVLSGGIGEVNHRVYAYLLETL